MPVGNINGISDEHKKARTGGPNVGQEGAFSPTQGSVGSDCGNARAGKKSPRSAGFDGVQVDRKSAGRCIMCRSMPASVRG